MKSALSPYIAAISQFRNTPAQPTPPTDPADEWRERNRPLVDRVRDLLKEIPPAVIADGLVLRELQIRLKGRIKRTCHAGELADCLRTLGFQRRRYWKEGRAGFNARWFPSRNTTTL
jgi:hypothetical protein